MWTVLIFLFLGGYWLLRGLFAGAEKTVERTGNFMERLTDESRIKMLGEYYTGYREALNRNTEIWKKLSWSEQCELADSLSVEIYGSTDNRYYCRQHADDLMTYKEGYTNDLDIWETHTPERIALPLIKWRRDIIYKNTGCRLPIYKIKKTADTDPSYWIHVPQGKYETIE